MAALVVFGAALAAACEASPALDGPPLEMTAAIAEAAARFELPQHVVARVVAVESGGDPRAVSPRGAMGLMQLMPRTWAMLRSRLGLGGDPFDVRDNLLAGAAYLRELHEQFGAPGYLAAYNAGPGRYAEHLRTGAALPAETRAYLRRVSGGEPPVRAGWAASPLFPAPAAGSPAMAAPAAGPNGP